MDDLKFAFRMLRKSPGFTAVAVLTLALGIGANTAIFSAVDAVLIRPLPYFDAGRLVMIWDDLSHEGIPKHFPAPAECLEWRRQNTVFSDIAATQPGAATLSGDSEPEQVPTRKTTANLWSVLGVKPLIGRVFTDEEDEKGVRVAVISHGLWQRRYGGSPDILGRKITVNDSPYEVIGVMPRGFYFMPARDIDMWMPASFPPWMRTNFSWHDAQVVARLKPGVTVANAKESMAALSRHLTEKDFRGPHAAIVSPLRDEMAGKTQTALILLLCASAALLLIASLGLYGLLAYTATQRINEIGVRMALGATSRDILLFFGGRGLKLTLAGLAVGLVLAIIMARFMTALFYGFRPHFISSVIAVSLILLTVATLACFVPSRRAAKIDPMEALRYE